jgi:hypothetical protein
LLPKCCCKDREPIGTNPFHLFACSHAMNLNRHYYGDTMQFKTIWWIWQDMATFEQLIMDSAEWPRMTIAKEILLYTNQ